MDKLFLYIGNKNYSTWSMRPWMAMKATHIPFEDVVIPFDFPAGNPRFRDVSPSGLVPLLHHGSLRVWESLAIIEYVAELYPDAGLWPREREARAVARAVCTEMLGGFRVLRNACSMNIRRAPKAIALPDGVMEDVRRIETIWSDLRQRSGGPFLFGDFSAADAMFAPVVNRFYTYELVHAEDTLAYMRSMMQHSAWREWEDAARDEPWIVPEDEA